MSYLRSEQFEHSFNVCLIKIISYNYNSNICLKNELFFIKLTVKNYNFWLYKTDMLSVIFSKIINSNLKFKAIYYLFTNEIFQKMQ